VRRSQRRSAAQHVLLARHPASFPPLPRPRTRSARAAVRGRHAAAAGRAGEHEKSARLERRAVWGAVAWPPQGRTDDEPKQESRAFDPTATPQRAFQAHTVSQQPTSPTRPTPPSSRPQQSTPSPLSGPSPTRSTLDGYILLVSLASFVAQLVIHKTNCPSGDEADVLS
jgi:hypothetical protein